MRPDPSRASPLRRTLLAATLTLAAQTPAVAAPTPTATVQVTITNLATNRGQIRVAICPRADFLRPHCPYQAQTPAHQGTTTLTLPDIPPGTYAAQAYQDENNDNRLGQTLLGLPAEPMGFSNNAPLRFGPPSFAAAAFSVTAPRTQITFALHAY